MFHMLYVSFCFFLISICDVLTEPFIDVSFRVDCRVLHAMISSGIRYVFML
jgi:hypothetical protein